MRTAITGFADSAETSRATPETSGWPNVRPSTVPKSGKLAKTVWVYRGIEFSGRRLAQPPLDKLGAQEELPDHGDQARPAGYLRIDTRGERDPHGRLADLRRHQKLYAGAMLAGEAGLPFDDRPRRVEHDFDGA